MKNTMEKNNKKYIINTYGCQMNIHESEQIAGILHRLGYAICNNINEADIVVFNTCCIRENAEKKIMGNIGEIKKIKRDKPELIVAVIGCMTQQTGMAESLRKQFPYINIIMGTNNINDFENAVLTIESKQKKSLSDINTNQNAPICEQIPQFRTSGSNAWVNIMFGCNNFCSYCIVPFVRGRERSRKPQNIFDEVNKCLDEGYKEITLLGQNVDSYSYENFDFCYLLENLSKIKGKFRLRFMTSHPKDFNKNVVDIIRSSPNICNNIHLPVQSGSNRILELMNRKYTREHYLSIINEIKTLPNVGITSDIMVGFPTETEDDFEDTMDLVKQVRFSTAFTFVYSKRKGTKAALMPQIEEAVKKERITKLVALQNKITSDISREYMGKKLEVLVEDYNPRTDKLLCGRTESGRLLSFEGDKSLIGQFVDVKITQTRNSALFGEMINNN